MSDTLRYGLYIAALTVILSLSGIFASFAAREVIAGALSLSTVVLVLLIGGAAYLTGSRAARRSMFPLSHAIVGGVVVSVVLALLILIETAVDLRFIFPNLTNPIGSALTFGLELVPGLAVLIGVGVGLGAVVGALLRMPSAVRLALLSGAGLTIVIGLLEQQIRSLLTLPDAIAVALAFAVGYTLGRQRAASPLLRVIIGALPGALIGVALSLLVGAGALGSGGVLRGAGGAPVLLGAGASGGVIAMAAIFAVCGALGAAAARGARSFHDGMIYMVITLFVIGLLNTQGRMTLFAAVITFALLSAASYFVPVRGIEAGAAFNTLPRRARRAEQRTAFLLLLLLLIVLPLMAGQYITNVLNGVGLYIIMGIGLNIVVGYAGLLDLGYVAFFAIGAYTVGLLTTPSLLTCGGVSPRELTPETISTACTGVMTFWQAWPLAILLSAVAGILLGIPVLRLRGDYLAIVTLGFGEIIRIIVRFDDFKDLFGAAQGIANIPRPVIDLTSINPTWYFPLTGEVGIYYLVLGGILLTAFIGARVAGTRLGRAWLAMRADEDVAQAMGINLVQAKLLAFAIGAAFAGMGGAVSGVRLYGAFPDSFTLLVSINVLSLIIIGGLGSIPGVVVGALVLVGLPEVLRELSDYRLLAFGALLVAAMLIRPQGLIPPQPRRLQEIAEERGLLPAASGEGATNA